MTTLESFCLQRLSSWDSVWGLATLRSLLLPSVASPIASKDWPLVSRERHCRLVGGWDSPLRQPWSRRARSGHSVHRRRSHPLSRNSVASTWDSLSQRQALRQERLSHSLASSLGLNCHRTSPRRRLFVSRDVNLSRKAGGDIAHLHELAE